MKAAVFHALASLTKDQLPLPLSQFGALLRASLQQSKQQALVEWSETSWKKPIKFFSQIAKPSSKNFGAAAAASSADAGGVDLVNDWVVDLQEHGQGQFVIAAINKASRLFREQKRSTDAAAELVRHITDQQGDDADGFDADSFVAGAQGRIEAMTIGFLSRKSGLAEDLDIVVFGDMTATSSAAALAAAIESAKNAKRLAEEAKFPSLDTQSSSQAASAPATAAATTASAAPPALLEFVSTDEAARRVVHFARGANLVVTNADVASMGPSAKAGDLKIQAGPLRSLWGNHTAPPSAPSGEVLRRVALHVAKAVQLRFQSGQAEIRRGVPPTLQLGAKKVNNHWVTTLTGVLSYYGFDPSAVLELLKRKLACSGRIEDDVASTKTQSKNTVSIVLTGQHVDDLTQFLTSECGILDEFVHSTAPPAKAKK